MAALLSAGCGGGPDAVTTPTDDYLQVIVGSSDSDDIETFSLVCGTGADDQSHPDPQAACDRLHGLDDPFAPLPTDVMCTEQYGGPQTASVVGRWAGERVDLELSRTDGCRIAQWDSLVPLVPSV